MARTSYSDETKAAVMAALLAGQSVSSVAREYKIPRGTIARWRADASEIIETERTQKSSSIDDLLRGYLKANLTALREQTKVFGNEKWLKRQDASEVAVLHGVLADKAVRLLEAFGGSEPTP